jgi:predicted PurR-regulated permease PerM
MQLFKNEESTQLCMYSLTLFFLLSLLSQTLSDIIAKRWLVSLLLMGAAILISELSYLYLAGNGLDQIHDNIEDYRAIMSQRTIEEEEERARQEQAQEEQDIQNQISPEQYRRPKKPYS